MSEVRGDRAQQPNVWREASEEKVEGVVMTLDLAQPEHREALLLAYTALAGPLPFARQLYLAEGLRRAPSEIHRDALRALSSPSDCAAIVRALLEGCGVALPSDEPSTSGDVDVCAEGNTLLIWLRLDGTWVRRDRNMADAPALILALLACTTEEEARAVLREAGR